MCSLVWLCVVWYNSIKIGLVWSCVVLCGTVQYNGIKVGLLGGVVVVWYSVEQCGTTSIKVGLVWLCTVWYNCINVGLVSYNVVQQCRFGVVQCAAISGQPAVLEETQVYSSFSLASTFGLKLRHTFVYILLCCKQNLAVIIWHEI